MGILWFKSADEKVIFMKERKKAYLVLQDGTVFEGFSMGASGVTFGEVVFNTCTSAYTDILSDPTYYGQIVAQTYPLAANRGVVADDDGNQIMSSGYVVREWCDISSDNKEISLDEYLRSRNIVGICGIDTRRLTRHLRDKGYVNGAITDTLENMDALLDKIKKYTISGAVRAISIKEPLCLKGKNATYNVVAIDYGSPRRQLNAFLLNGCNVTFVPAFTTAEEIKRYSPDGLVLCDGPADPDDEPEFIENIRKMTELGIPVFAVGLGHQMLALASDFKIIKMEKGHRGSNQPVRVSDSNRVMVTDQNHGYAVDIESVNPKVADVIMTNVNDSTVEGLRYKKFKGLSVQFTPKGDADSSTGFIIRDFFKMMDGEENE